MEIVNGVWPTAITAFTKDNKIDYPANERLIEWYIENGVDGIFAMCQSSEMFYLTLEEKIDLINFTLKVVNGRVPVIASGHTSFGMKEQIYELSKIADTGISAVVLITNILATEEKSEGKFKESVDTLLESLPTDITLGMYECPQPFKYLVSPELLKWCSDTGRFGFLKDTCCDIDMIKTRLDSIKGSNMKLFNANAVTLLDSMKLGASGFSGIMLNLYPKLLSWLAKNIYDERAEKVQAFFDIASMIEYLNYPYCAKVFLGDIIGIDTKTRRPFDSQFTKTNKKQLKSLDVLYNDIIKGIF